MHARDRLKSRHPFEFPEKRAFAFEGAAVDDFHRAKRTGHSPRQPNLAVSAAPDHAQHFVIGNDWYLSRNLIGNERFYTTSGGEAILGTTCSVGIVVTNFGSIRCIACVRGRR